MGHFDAFMTTDSSPEVVSTPQRELTRFEKLKLDPVKYAAHLARNREYRRENPQICLAHNRRYRRRDGVREKINARNKERYYSEQGRKEKLAKTYKKYRESLQGYMRGRIRAAFWVIRCGSDGKYARMMDAINGKKSHVQSISQTHVSFVIPLAHFDLSNSVQLRKALHHTNIVGMEIEQLMLEPVQRPFIMEMLPFVDTEDALFEAESFIRKCKQKVGYVA